MKNLYYISIAILIACLSVIKSVIASENAGVKIPAKSSSFNLILDDEQEFSFTDNNSSPEFYNPLINYSFYKYSSTPVLGNTSRFYCFVSCKLDPLTTDIPPPLMAV